MTFNATRVSTSGPGEVYFARESDGGHTCANQGKCTETELYGWEVNRHDRKHPLQYAGTRPSCSESGWKDGG